MSSNPYSPPRAAVSDVEAAQEYQEIRMWSASGRLGRLRYLAYATGASLLAGAAAGLMGGLLGQSLGTGLASLVYIAAVVYSAVTIWIGAAGRSCSRSFRSSA